MGSFNFFRNKNKQVSNHKATIIPIASGKGGVGKSFISGNLAIALAELGQRVVVADLDFGGANLHSMLGLPNRFPGVGDFLRARTAELDELLVPCETPNLYFLPGDGKTPFLANLAYAQKVKLISRIRKLQADYILLDLGAGSSFNTLDFFRLAERGIMVTTPEPTAVMGMLVFLKNFLLRSIERKLARNYKIRVLLREMCNQPMDAQMLSIKEVHQKIVEQDPQAADVVEDIFESCRPRIIINMGENPEDSKMALKISRTLGEILSIEADYFGFVFKDKDVLSSIRKRSVFITNCRNSLAAENITRIAQRILKFWNQPVKDSAELLFNQVKKDYETRQQSTFAA